MKYPDHQEGTFLSFSRKLLFFYFIPRIPSAAQRGQGSLIIESKDTHDNDLNNDNDDDDDANFLIQEEKPSATKSFVRKSFF